MCMNALKEGGHFCNPTTDNYCSGLDGLSQFNPPSSDVSLCSGLGQDTHDTFSGKEVTYKKLLCTNDKCGISEIFYSFFIITLINDEL